jgi:hypothetical protein
VGTCGRLFMLVVTPKTKNKLSHSNEQRGKIIQNYSLTFPSNLY